MDPAAGQVDPAASEPAPPHTDQPEATSDLGAPPSDAAATPAAPAPDAAPDADHREPVKQQVFEGGAKQTIYTARSLGASKLSALSMSSDGGGGGGGGGDAPPRPRRSDRIALNLSGTVFVTTRDTLMRDERTYFAAMLRMQPPPPRHEPPPPPPVPPPAAEFFVDRDPTHFRHILNYLRGNRMNLECRGAESLAFLDELLLEAQYFNINGLCEELARRIAEITRRQKEEASEDKDFRLIKCDVCDVQDVFHEWVIEKNYEFESMQVCDDLCLVVLARRVSRGELALVERLMKT